MGSEADPGADPGILEGGGAGIFQTDKQKKPRGVRVPGKAGPWEFSNLQGKTPWGVGVHP